MINANLWKHLMVAGGFVLLCGVLLYAGYRAGYNEAIAEVNSQVAEVTQDALVEQERLNAAHLLTVAKYESLQRSEVSKVSALQSRLTALQDSRSSMVSGAVDDYRNSLIELFNEAINHSALPENPDKPFTLGEEATPETYLLYCVAEYNSCSIQLNTLIDEVE